MRSIVWHGLRLAPCEDRPGLTVTDTSQQHRVVGTLDILLDEPWHHGSADHLDDEVEWHWTHPSGGRAIARVSVGPHLHVRLALIAAPHESLSTAPARIAWYGQAPVRAWTGGSLAVVILDERPSDGRVIAATLTSGFATSCPPRQRGPAQQLVISAGSAPVWLAPGASTTCTWAVRDLKDLAAVRSLLPPWMPRTITPAAGDAVRIDLPDAVVRTDAHSETDEHGTLVWAGAGRHEIGLQGTGLDCTVALTWNGGYESILTRRAAQLLRTTDPRRASAAQVAIVDRADAEGTLPHDEAQSFLAGYCQDLLDRHPAPPDPLSVPPLVRWAAGSPGVLRRIDAMVDELAPGPGPMLGWLAAAIALRSAGIAIGARPPVDPDDPLCLALRDVLTHSPAPSEAVWRATTWLHGPLPQTRPAAERLRSALSCAILSISPAGWHLENRLGVNLPEEIEHTWAWLAAEEISDAELAWLVWS